MSLHPILAEKLSEAVLPAPPLSMTLRDARLPAVSGKVHAGFPDKEDAIVFALGFNPSHVKIGSISASGSEDGAGTSPEFASVEKNKIIVRDYMKASPFRRMPWPEAI